ncbi:LysM peptidoglycan-binding domain-containing protein [Runella slithyformis]|uniref:Lytic transglycosylase catalytic n=1 Tax=Runella slithyformis (strain ATCC 29530 / DSM 19594 / LMG 11500 / NCIMB 11436 / LSU 4) TaxID=761193 RepID=A0A7U3ZH34_RUNSL|nr:LysM peptidoglycan-binding domain-containing protein [Runella slithyformis]AEI47112.1 Lytic transglycosylase catalytic [Runella slithyformis DSM 19594]
MKRTSTLTFFLSFFTLSSLSAQAPVVPVIPTSVGFAGMNIQIDQDARAIIQSDVKALLSNRKYWESKLDRCVMHFPIIEGILIDEDVPTDFKFLALQESGLQPDAVSASNAVGFWQFKRETAVDYGLRVDDMIDERKNISASTRAAAKYLKKSNTLFNNWIASLYSYYLGAGGISKNIPGEWSYAKEVKLTGKSDRYILRFLAHKIAVESAIDRYQTPVQTVLLEYPQAKGRTLQSIAAELNIDEATLRRENSWLNVNEIPNDRDYSLIVPVANDQLSATRTRIASAQKPNLRDNFAQKDIGFPVLVRAEGYSNDLLLYEINGLPGIMAGGNDNVETLARKAKISFSSFLRYNEMSERDPIVPGDVYYLAKKGKRAAVPFHTVREGESLWKVSQVYGIRVKYIVKNNRIDNRNQRPQTGRVLWLTKKRPRNTPVEVVDMPLEEWLPGNGKSQPRPGVQENSRSETAPVTSAKIPQNPSERKVYTPKMADTPPPVKTQPTETNESLGVEITDAASVPKKSTSTTDQPTKPTKRAPSFNPTDDDRVVIINDDEPVKRPVANKQTVKTAAGKQQMVVKNTPPAAPKEPVEEPIVIANEKPKPAAPAKPSPTTATANNKSLTHTVEPGQTFYSISKMYDVTVNDILYWNNLPQDAKLLSGQKLTIRPVGNTLSQQPKADEFVSHTVVQGETMFSISKKYGVKMDEIKEWNGLPDTGVKIGQQLKIKKQ